MWKTDLEVKGYARIRNVFDKWTIDRIRSEAIICLTRLPANDPQRLQRKPDEETDLMWPALLFWPQDLSPFLKDVSRSAELSSVVAGELGKNVLQLNNQIYYRLPGDNDQFAWHQDISFRTPPEQFDQIETKYLQTIIVVDEMRGNGCIEFIPGSHKEGIKNLVPRDGSEKGLRVFHRNGLEGEKVEANPGDLLLWNVMVIHGSETNESNRPRMTYMNGFAAADALKGKHDFPWYLKDGRFV